MIKKLTFLSAILLSLWLNSGCNSTDSLYDHAPGEITPENAERATGFAKITNDGYYRIIRLTPDEVKYYQKYPESLQSRLLTLNLNVAALSITSAGEVDKTSDAALPLANLINVLDEKGIKCFFYLKESDFLYKLPLNPVLRRNSSKQAFFNEFAQNFKGFAELLNNKSEMPVIIIDLEMDGFTAENSERPDGMLYLWSKNGYGNDGENNMVFQESLNNIKSLRQILKLEQIMLAIDHKVLQKILQKELKNASIAGLFQICDNIIIKSAGKNGAESVKNCGLIFNSSNLKSGFLIANEIAVHSVGAPHKLRRKNWDFFIQDMTAIMELKKHDSFGGFLLTPLESLEILWRRL